MGTMRTSQTTAAPAAGEPRDEFLSEEDLDLRNLSDAELIACWNAWLEQAQANNDMDKLSYNHGVFETAPPSDAP